MPMSRMLKWTLVAAAVEMTLVAAAVSLARWQALPAHAPDGAFRMFWIVSGSMAFFPAWLSAGAWLTVRKMSRRGLLHAQDTLRHGEITLMGAAAMAVGVQAWLGGTMLGVVPEKAIGIRLVEALTGVFIMVAGNFAAKTSPPTGERAPDAAAWTRGMLRIGWFGVAAGLIIVVAAIVAPIGVMVWVILGSTATYAFATVWQSRIIHRRPA